MIHLTMIFFVCELLTVSPSDADEIDLKPDRREFNSSLSHNMQPGTVVQTFRGYLPEINVQTDIAIVVVWQESQEETTALLDNYHFLDGSKTAGLNAIEIDSTCHMLTLSIIAVPVCCLISGQI